MKTTGIRTFQMVQNISGPVPGGINDWPANIQDAIFAAVERKSRELELPLAIVRSHCSNDDGVWYVNVIVSEVVAADEREVKGLFK